MQCYFSRMLRVLSLIMLAFSLHAGAAPMANTPSSIRLEGHIPRKGVAEAVLLENLEASTPVSITFTLPIRKQKELERLIQRMYDPTDKQQYGKYLTSEEFVERFAPSQEDYEKVIAYAKGLGLKVTDLHSNRLLLKVSGTAQDVEKAFNLCLQCYQKSDGRKFYAPSDNPEVPVEIASVIRGIVGLDNHTVWRPHHRQKMATEGPKTLGASPNTYPNGPQGGFSPNNIKTAYNLTGVSANGSGQVIALLELAGYNVSDINAYTNYFGLPAAQLTNVSVDGGSTGRDAEVALDIELALALAPESQIYVYEGPNSNGGILAIYNRILSDNIAKQISTSWGSGEDENSDSFLNSEYAIFQSMAAHGQTIYAAAGDEGAYDDYPPSRDLVVDDPGSQPYVCAVGGTSLTVNANTCAWSNEVVWNDGLNGGAGGGGVSAVWSIPSWQTDVTTLYSTTHRNTPDVTLNADENTGYSIYYNGGWTIYGGTSCAAPLWAAFTACVNQQRVANSDSVLGFVNPTIYSIGTGSSYNEDFHDIVEGNNFYYDAGVGYDNASGWGSFNGINLFDSLTNSTPPPPPPPPSTPSLSITMSHSGSFNKKEEGSYLIEVSNQGSRSTSGVVSVRIALPHGLLYRSFSGSGWSFNRQTKTFTRNTVLRAGSSYPAIQLDVYVTRRTPAVVVPTATVSGGGSASSTVSDPTNVNQ